MTVSDYKAPVRDMKFVLNEVFAADKLLATMPGTQEVTEDLIGTVLEEAGKVAESLLAPLNRIGDEEGCGFDAGAVTTPSGFRAAYETFSQGGWIGLAGDPAYGGQGMPKMLGVCVEEMTMAANSALALYAVLSAGASLAIARHASNELKQTYLPKLYEGSWSATMCLTESHAGTDLGMIRTRAAPQGDGSYKVTGTKIFITGGEHDLTDNIIHLVLAKLPDAPAGPRGISLFLVPKFLPDERGEAGESNGVSCGSIEHKMGLKGSATCVMNFDDATGYLVGELNKGLACMFTMMNYERLTIGLQGLGAGDASYQTAAAYARDRLQGRSATGPVAPEKPADPLLVHPDVRRMLLTMRANTEGGRALAAYVGSQLDVAYFHPDEKFRKRASLLVALLTPITKAAFTDRGFEACVLGQQVLGGHGYIREWGQEQLVRDARIAQIYEGTNGIQALDLMGRKVVFDNEGMLDVLVDEIRDYIRSQHNGRAASFVAVLSDALNCLEETTRWVRQANGDNPNEVGAASVPYLDLMTLILYCYMWARMVAVASAALEKSGADKDFYQAKIHLGCYFLDRLMPRYKSLAAEIRAGSDVLMAMDAELF
jgi:alkylation response protein AidB-like acyl-CoA dehydrogenase